MAERLLAEDGLGLAGRVSTAASSAERNVGEDDGKCHRKENDRLCRNSCCILKRLPRHQHGTELNSTNHQGTDPMVARGRFHPLCSNYRFTGLQGSASRGKIGLASWGRTFKLKTNSSQQDPCDVQDRSEIALYHVVDLGEFFYFWLEDSPMLTLTQLRSGARFTLDEDLLRNLDISIFPGNRYRSTTKYITRIIAELIKSPFSKQSSDLNEI